MFVSLRHLFHFIGRGWPDSKTMEHGGTISWATRNTRQYNHWKGKDLNRQSVLFINLYLKLKLPLLLFLLILDICTCAFNCIILSPLQPKLPLSLHWCGWCHTQFLLSKTLVKQYFLINKLYDIWPSSVWLVSIFPQLNLLSQFCDTMQTPTGEDNFYLFFSSMTDCISLYWSSLGRCQVCD